ncbi:hypothetical protein GHT09_009946 [Marmota monax]|uniref:Uncharacterized protein n=1 Tax=Marmota monax TaxID=9995 RepID=A0A834QHW5_MARMO|nr:hypothetical protein GHT09_009946 [Marmota monax]
MLGEAGDGGADLGPASSVGRGARAARQQPQAHPESRSALARLALGAGGVHCGLPGSRTEQGQKQQQSAPIAGYAVFSERRKEMA